MASDDRSREPGSIEEAREREDEARAREADAEAREAERQREAEFPPGEEPRDRQRDGPGVVPSETDEERTGVMRPPGGESS